MIIFVYNPFEKANRFFKMLIEWNKEKTKVLGFIRKMDSIKIFLDFVYGGK